MKLWRALSIQALCGLVFGLQIYLILAAISWPKYPGFSLPISMARQADLLGSLQPGWIPVVLVGAAAVLVAWFAAARTLNEHLSAVPFGGRAWWAILLSGIALAGAFFLANVFEGDLASPDLGARLYRLIVYSAAGAVSWLIISIGGFAGELREGRDLRSAFSKGWRKTAACGALFGVFFYLAAVSFSVVTDFLAVLEFNVWKPYDAVAPSVDFAIMNMAQFGIFFPVVGSLAAACADDGAAPRKRLRRAVPGIVLAALSCLAAGGLYVDAIRNRDWRVATLIAAADLPDREAPRMTEVALGFDGAPKISARRWDNSVTFVFSRRPFEMKVPGTEANALALEKYLAGRGRGSIFEHSAREVLLDVYASIWRPEAGLKAIENHQHGLGLLGTVTQIIRLAACAPITPENRMQLEKLSDPERYRVAGHDAFHLSRAWVRFGEPKRAEQWLETARRTGASSDSLKDFSIPTEAPLARGILRGRIRLRGRSNVPIVVGLINEGDAKAASGIQSYYSVPFHLVGSQAVGRDGRFQFVDIGEGRYALSLLVPGDVIPPDASRISANRNPGILALDKKRPVADVGDIVLTVKAP